MASLGRTKALAAARATPRGPDAAMPQAPLADEDGNVVDGPWDPKAYGADAAEADDDERSEKETKAVESANEAAVGILVRAVDAAAEIVAQEALPADLVKQVAGTMRKRAYDLSAQLGVHFAKIAKKTHVTEEARLRKARGRAAAAAAAAATGGGVDAMET